MSVQDKKAHLQSGSYKWAFDGFFFLPAGSRRHLPPGFKMLFYEVL
jgi:hypothetical protein